MHALNSSSVRISGRLLTAALFVVATCSAALATDGTWGNLSGGNYSVTSNWDGNQVAGGTDATATFNKDISDEVAITLDTNPTLGHMVFGDTNTGTPGIWSIYSGTGDTITLDGTSPSITVNPLGTVTIPGVGDFNDVFLQAQLAGTAGLTKLGDGILTLSVADNLTQSMSLTGGINVNAGTLRFDSNLAFTTDSLNQLKTLANGTTIENNGTTLNNVTVASGATATLQLNENGTNYLTDITGAGTGETLNVNLASGGTTYTVEGNWSGLANLNLVGQGGTPGVLRVRPNPGSSSHTAFNTNSFTNTNLYIDNARMFFRTNSYGNDIPIGALTGTATTTLEGAAAGAGSAVRYHIGSLNTSTTFAGDFSTAIDGSAGLSIEKVGTGTLTLSGSLVGDLTNNSWNNGDADIGRQGGVVRVSQGTLALTNAATSVPGGYVGEGGPLYTTIDVLASATLDVSGTNTTFSTSALQQLQGSGTIVGNYNHDEGFLRPGDVSTVDNDTSMTNVPVATAGTITFNNNLSFGGSGGEIVFDISPSTSSGNDLIQVNGVTNLSGTPKLDLSFLGGFTTGTYTILSSAGGFGGTTPSGWTVNWPGRGSAPTLSISGNNLQMAVSAASTGNVNWTGATNGTWDINSTQNWYNNSTHAADKYYELDSVTFADTYGSGTAVSNFTVTLNTSVSPSAVVVDSSNDYSITGTGKITGGTGFTKRGTGTLTFQLFNDFSGSASIEGGTVEIGTNNGALGTGTLTLAGGRLNASNTASGVYLTNSSLIIATGTSNTISVGGNVTRPLGLPAFSGDGDLTLSASAAGKGVDMNNAGFTGNLNIGASGDAGGTYVRMNGGGSGLPDSVVTLVNGAGLRDRATSAQTIAIGALAGDNTATVSGYDGGSSSPQQKTWEIGALNMSTVFAGAIVNGKNDTPTNVTKVGTGTLTLSGTNTYTGDTRVEDGVLSITSAYLADAADVYLTTGAVFNLNFTDTDVIDSLFFDNVNQLTGTWGSLASSASHKSAFFTGLGLLSVTTYEAPPLLIGDYNQNGIVDAADYTVWRDNLGTAFVLPNRDPANTGNVSPADYTSWKAHFGETGGGGGSLASLGAVPEPSTALLACLALVWSLLVTGRRRR